MTKKAYIATNCKSNEPCYVLLWCNSSKEAKKEAFNYHAWDLEDPEYTDLRIKRIKELDDYTKAKDIPVSVMIDLGFGIQCSGLSKPLTLFDGSVVPFRCMELIYKDTLDDACAVLVNNKVYCSKHKENFNEDKCTNIT